VVYYYKYSAAAEMGDRARAKWVEKWGGCCATFHGVGAGSPSNATSPGTRPTSVPPASCLHGHNRHGPKIGGCCAPLFGGARSHLTSRGLGRGLPPHQLAHDSCNRMAAMHMVRKVAGCCAPLLGGGETGSPSNTVCWAQCVRWGSILVHPTVWHNTPTSQT